jgi:nucleoid-associated protein YgaU
MPSRYDQTSIITNAKKINPDGTERTVRRLSSLFYPEFTRMQDVQIISQQGDRLDLLALEYYSDETLWYVIARANGLGKGTLLIPPGTVIRIPYYDEYQGIAALFSSFNRER